MDKKEQKEFDSVKMMREIRDKLSEKLKDMSFEEQQEYIRKRVKAKPSARK
jgi:hypothetical protein